MTKRILPKAYAAFLLYLAALPLFLLPAAALIPGRVWISLLLPLPALLLTGWAGLLPAKRRTTALLLSLLVMAAGCVLLFMQRNPLAMLLFLPCLLIMLWFMPAMTRPLYQEWTVSRLGLGIVLHIIAQFLKGIALFEGIAPVLTWIFTSYLIACLFSVNRIMLMGNSSSASKTLLFLNRRLLVILCLLALLLTNLKAVGTAIRTAILWIITAIAQVIVWVISFMEQGEEAVGGGPDPGMLSDFVEVTEPSLFIKIMEIVLASIAGLIVAVLLFFALKHLLRLLKKAFRMIFDRLQSYRRKISADYHDLDESLLDWGEIRKTAKTRLDRFKRRYLPAAWEKLSAAQRVRRVYALLLRQPETPDPALTAREMLLSGALKLTAEDAGTLASLYEQARYSDHPISVQQADDLRKRAGV